MNAKVNSNPRVVVQFMLYISSVLRSSFKTPDLIMKILLFTGLFALQPSQKVGYYILPC
jgi:hypothetical protein